MTKLVIGVRSLGANGYAAAEWLRRNENVTVELAKAGYIMALLSDLQSEMVVTPR